MPAFIMGALVWLVSGLLWATVTVRPPVWETMLVSVAVFIGCMCFAALANLAFRKKI